MAKVVFLFGTFIKSLGITTAGLVAGSPILAAKNTAGFDPADVREVRKACFQFAMQYFHFCKSLVETLGIDKALEVVQKTVFELSIDRSDRMREKAVEQGLQPTLENFRKVSDLSRSGWDGWMPDMGGVFCPYAEVWLNYFDEYPWFKQFASHFCNVVDTTNIENFIRTTSHCLTL
ncbi:MAG: L-2-amino-thiazoline-4-carboxylic acid hydrolase [Tannerella sp.]|jgi:hypothetical protein|nr:L-2-amino-thiazoline-4-carboxylic acid hydrolase [Tannerella sp.]